MTAVLDASAVLALLFAEPGHERVAEHLDGAVISTVNWSEVVQKLAQRGLPDLARPCRSRGRKPCPRGRLDEARGLVWRPDCAVAYTDTPIAFRSEVDHSTTVRFLCVRSARPPYRNRPPKVTALRTSCDDLAWDAHGAGLP